MPAHLRDGTRGEYAADAAVHVAGVVGGAAAVRWMWARAGASVSEVWAALLRALAPRDSGSDATDVSGANVLEAAVLVYGVGLMSMLLCSAAYNMLYWTPLGPALRRFDHAAIFLKIVSGYHPWLAATALKDWEWSPAVLGAVWTVGLTGVTIKLLLHVHLLSPALQRTVDNLSHAAYLLLGWTGGLIAWPVKHRVEFVPAALLLAGGLVYTVGFVFFRWESLKYQMAIWHACVLGGAALQFLALAMELELLERFKAGEATTGDGESAPMGFDAPLHDAIATAANAAEL